MKNPREMLGAALGGIVATACDVGTLILLVEYLHVVIPLAAFVASGVGAAACFLMNKHVAFRDRSPVTIVQIARFGLVAVSTAVLMALMMKLVAVDLHVPYLIAKALCAAAVFVVWTYPAQRRLVFARA
ncbi:MAG TPA: GtrA family protein [Kofleriaceae bacterium]|nr:GtrA family protein [Kofleriaceae bacterium]